MSKLDFDNRVSTDLFILHEMKMIVVMSFCDPDSILYCSIDLVNLLTCFFLFNYRLRKFTSWRAASVIQGPVFASQVLGLQAHAIRSG